ncbi:hypothetical protein GCM10011586_27120 [Silvibacterium dinghuense]|nr:hypothetical protein GCM10011586_27120 [Silvibacterium dinghuense]
MVSRWERWKGVHVFLEAIAKLTALEPETSFFIVGGPHPRDPDYAHEIETMAARLNLGDRLILAGQRPADEVPLWLASADLIVHPCIGTEPFGMAVAEAMGMGRTVIASNTGGIPEIIRHGKDGFLIPPGDSTELADIMLRLLRDPALRAETGKQARERGRSFSVDRFADRIDSLLDTAVTQ